MKKINIAETDISAIAIKLKQCSSKIPEKPPGPEWSNPPAVKVIDCVLSLNRRYDSFVVPRLKTFQDTYPKIERATDLAELMDKYETPHTFVQKELNYNHEDRANTLACVIKYVCTIVEKAKTVEEEKETLKQWAIQAKPQECYTLNIKGFKLAGFQYLRMLFGADTAKPDVHIIKFLSDILNREISDIAALLLLEAACKREELSVRAVDKYIWNRGARPEKTTNTTPLNDELSPEYDEMLLKDGIRGKYAEKYAAGTKIVHLAPDVADAFPTEEAVNEALRFVATFDYTYKPVSTSNLAFKVAERCWWYKTSNKNLANMFDISMEKLESLFSTDIYKQSVFNLMCVQYNSEEFEKWVQRYEKKYQSGMASAFSQRMKLDKANHEKMLAGVRAFHAAAKEGVKVKVMKRYETVSKSLQELRQFFKR